MTVIYRIDVDAGHERYTRFIAAPDERRALRHVAQSLFKVCVATAEDLDWARHNSIPVEPATEMI